MFLKSQIAIYLLVGTMFRVVLCYVLVDYCQVLISILGVGTSTKAYPNSYKYENCNVQNIMRNWIQKRNLLPF